MTVISSRWLMSPGSSSVHVVAQVREAAEAMGSDCVVFEDFDDAVRELRLVLVWPDSDTFSSSCRCMASSDGVSKRDPDDGVG